ncbi:MAG TPA: hypothetical protein VGX70_04185, partial [Gemmataceae bacterium]|nr:hypothetical protein [Gemmataceae bacterium]
MNSSTPSPNFRSLVCTLLIVVAGSQIAGRILSVARVYEPDLSRPEGTLDDPRGPWPKTRPNPMPTHGDNDRSRWDTIRALVDQGTYAIGERDPSRITPDNKYGDQGIITEDGWKTIDKVLNPADHKFYSSKPPFLPTLFAGEYWLLKHVFGWSINENRWLVMRIILLTVNLLPFVIFLALLARLAEDLGTTDWGRIFVVASGCFATLMIPFATTFNNHTIAACTALFALYPTLSILKRIEDRESKMEDGGSTVEDRGSKIEDRKAAAASPSSILHPPSSFLLAGFFAGFTACSELPATSFLVFLFLILCWQDWRKALAYFLPAATIPIAFFFLTNYWAIGQWTPAYGEFGGPWYEYEGSHWKMQPGVERHGIDFAYYYESKFAYALHLLLGHHGLFSLTPIFLLGLAGCVAGVYMMARGENRDRRLELMAGLTIGLVVVVAGFYILRGHGNYGGWTAGPRWFIWLTPFLLLTMLPALDWLAPRRWGRVLAYVFLAVSVISANYPAWNP